MRIDGSPGRFLPSLILMRLPVTFSQVFMTSLTEYPLLEPRLYSLDFFFFVR